MKEPPALRAWLFRIAHNRALDYLRRYDRRMSEPLDVDTDEFIDRTSDPDTLLPREQAVTLAIARFAELAPAQRSCVILKDVLDYSLEDISDSLEISVSAVKAALHRAVRACKSCPHRAAPMLMSCRRTSRRLFVATRHSSTPVIGTQFARC